MNKKINAEIIADSVDTIGNRITSFIVDVPQIIVKELLRHRMFSFSSSSMRAVPFNNVIKDIKENMFIPLAFQAHHSGMQGNVYLEGNIAEDARKMWIETGLTACKQAEELYHLGGVTKQLCSRIIEPFGYAKILVTATEFDGFFELRCPKFINEHESGEDISFSRKDFINKLKQRYPTNWEIELKDFFGIEDNTEEEWLALSESQAEIHIQALAEAMWDARNESIPKVLKTGEWHVPFGDKIDLMEWLEVFNADDHLTNNLDLQDELFEKDKLKIATARAARLSYSTHDGEINYEKDIKLHDQLLDSKHFSPFEHCARVMSEDEYYDFFKGSLGQNEHESRGWCNNFKGFIPYRYLIEK